MRKAFLIFFFISLLYLTLSRPASWVNDVAVFDDLVYLADGKNGLRVVDVSNPDTPKEVGAFKTWGTAKAVDIVWLEEGDAIRKYAFLAEGGRGLHILDVTNASNIKEVSVLDLPGDAVDVKVRQNIAYVAAEGAGLQIIQVGDIRRPVVIGTYEVAGDVVSVASLDQSQVYIGDTNEKLTVLDLSNPISPRFLGTYSAQEEIADITLNGGYIYLAARERGLVVLKWEPSDLTESGLQIVETAVLDTPGEAVGLRVSGVYAYLADNEGGFRLIDISTPEQPVEIAWDESVGTAVDLDVSGDYAYIADGYDGLQVVHTPVYADLKPYGDPNEQGFAEDVVVQRGLAYLADGDKGLRILDVGNPADPREVASYDIGGYAVALDVRGDFAYVANRDLGGLQILPVSDPANLQATPVFFDTPGQPHDLLLLEDYVLVADGDGGVRIINISNPSAPYEMAFNETTGNAVGLDVTGDYLYIADSGAGLRIVDLSTPVNPVELAVYDTPGDARSVTVIEEFEDSPSEGSSEDSVDLEREVQRVAYVADGSGGLSVADVTDPEGAVLLDSYQDIVFVQEVIVIGETAFVAGREAGLVLLDVSNPVDIQPISTFDSPGSANHLYIEGDYAYIADGGRGLRIVDLINPEEMREVGFYDAPATATKVTTSGDYAFLVDGVQGLWVVDVFSPQVRKTIGFYETPGEPRSLTVEGSFAFIADGSEGFRIVDISNPSHPEEVAYYDTTGIVVDVDVAGNYAFIADEGNGLRIVDLVAPEGLEEIGFLGSPVNPRGVVVRESYAYLPDREAGLWVVNIEDPTEPAIASLFDDVVDARSVVVRGGYAFVVSGEQGLAVIDVSNPTQPRGVARLGTPGEAEDLYVSGEYAFIADGARGVSVIDISNPANPARINFTETNDNAVGIHVVRVPSSEGNPEHFMVFTAVLGEGLQVSEAVKLVEPVSVGFYETPGAIAAWQAIQSINAGRSSGKAMRSLLGLLTSYLLIGGLGFIFWSGFFAQFVLPLQDIEERWLAFKRTLIYALGRHGPAIRIENGQVVQRKGEQKRRGPGVALLDTASGAMLRKKTFFTRPVGPGVVFTDTGEYVHQEAVDLHIQVEPRPPLGPLKDEDPFEPRQEDESEGAYQERQDRRVMTSGLTRDGVEVVPKISAIVRIESEKPSSKTHFGYRSESVRLAVTREGVELDTLRHVRWYELPAYLAVDLWREYVRKFTLDELFDATTGWNRGVVELLKGDDVEPESQDRGLTGLEIIKSMVEMRLTQAVVPEFDGDGYPTKNEVTSREYQILKRMGIQLISTSISSLAIPQDVEDRLVDQWLSTWLQRAREERERVDQRRSYAIREAKEAALLRHVNSAAQVLYQAMEEDPSQPPDLQESILSLLRGTHQLFIRDAQLHRWLINDEEAMLDVIEWVRRQGK